MPIHSLPTGRWPKSETLHSWLQDLSAGAICSVLSIAYSLSYATLIFSGPLAEWLGYGMAVTLLSASIGALVIGLRSSVPFAIAGPDSSTSAVLAALVAKFAHSLVIGARTENILQHTVLILALATALTGIVLLVLGITRAGRAIRFVPYPVIGGFLGATGWLIVVGGAQVTTGQRVTIDTASVLFDSLTGAKLLTGVATAIVLFLGRRWVRSSFALPGLLLACVAAVHLALLPLGISVAEAQSSGWFFMPQSVVALASPWHGDELRRFPWETIPSLSGDLLSVIFVTTITMLLNTTGVELATQRDADLDRELKSHGLANLLAAAFGGCISVTSVSRTSVNYLAGATSRLPAITVAAILAAMIWADPSFLGYVPKCVLGGLLFYLGADLLYRWLVDSLRRLAVLEYLSLLAIASIIIEWGFVAGLSIGVVIGCATFALSASRIPAIKFSFDGSEYHSSLDRGHEELAALTDHGQELQGMSLQGYLFFGSANRLHEHIKALLAARSKCRLLLFDFRLVTGIDSSATNSFRQIKQLADRCGTGLVLVNMTPDVQSAFRIAGLISSDVLVVDDLDHALEQCENAIIGAYRTAGSDATSLRQWLVQVVSAEHALHLAGECERLEVPGGTIIARQGEAADSMHFILDGRVSIVVNAGGGRKIRVRSLGRHTTIGEMGLITGQARSATIETEIASVLYVLKAEAFERLKQTNPALCQALLTYVIRVMAERLNFANRTIGALRR
jgi:sulfate permease, SulP family